MARSIYYVTLESGKWHLADPRPRGGATIFDSKEDAVAEGQRRARENQPSQLMIHSANGGIEAEYTYGDERGRTLD